MVDYKKEQCVVIVKMQFTYGECYRDSSQSAANNWLTVQSLVKKFKETGSIVETK